MLSLPVWGAWIETFNKSFETKLDTSLPVWEAWIETHVWSRKRSRIGGPPRVGSVD